MIDGSTVLLLAEVVAVALVVVAFVAARKYSTTKPDPAKVFTKFQCKPTQGPTLSIVVPCYNEEERLPPMLQQTLDFCLDAKKRCVDDATSRAEGLFADFEIVVVDDCSRDKTADVVTKFAKDHPEAIVKLVRVNPNRGKGFAVRRGFFEASGDYVLMADGDNATQISDVTKLFKALRKPLSSSGQPASNMPPVIAIGSRAHLEEKAIARRTFFRTVLMKVFHFVVSVTYFFGTRGSLCKLRDTQCGFKLFDRRVTEILFLNNRLERWAFDVEILLTARRRGLKVAEVPVRWEEIPGSKVRLRGMVQMGLECLLMCFTYSLGVWSIVKPPSKPKSSSS